MSNGGSPAEHSRAVGPEVFLLDLDGDIPADEYDGRGCSSCEADENCETLGAAGCRCASCAGPALELLDDGQTWEPWEYSWVYRPPDEYDDVPVPQARPYAASPCRGKPVYTKKGKVKFYDMSKGGQIVGPFYKPAYREASLCIQMLVDEHEKSHRDDPDLNEACDLWIRAKYHNKKKKAASIAFSDQLDVSECAEYELDLACLEKLEVCCANVKGRTKKMGKKNVRCCDCADVKEATRVTKSMQRARKCEKKKKK